MKSYLLILCLFTAACARPGQTPTAPGGQEYGHTEGNGGDPCESRIQVIRADMESWIKGGGPVSLKYPDGLAEPSYSVGMLNMFSRAKVSCTSAVIKVGGNEKICRNAVVAGELRIECNQNRFMSTSETEQYKLIHHEYAGLAGFETTSAGSSSYTLSNQLSDFLENIVVKRLSIKPKGVGRCRFSQIAGVYAGFFTRKFGGNPGDQGEETFPVSLTLIPPDEPTYPYSLCPKIRAIYSRPDLTSGAGTITASGFFSADRMTLEIASSEMGGFGIPGHQKLNLNAIWNSNYIEGKMYWWNYGGNVRLIHCSNPNSRVDKMGRCQR